MTLYHMDNLSNTATPKYYAEFRTAVLRGEIPVNREISMEMNRIDDSLLIQIFITMNAVQGFIKFWNLN